MTQQPSDSCEPHAGRWALCLEYDGSAYSGWQKQASPQLPTVQGCLEQALSKVADREISIICAGRTDAGVHATAQVVHFDCDATRPVQSWVRGGNSLLPPGIRVRWASPVDQEFHARFSATSRTYVYLVNNSRRGTVFGRKQTLMFAQQLDHERMETAAQSLLGEQDFSAFRAAGCQSKTPFRCVSSISVRRFGYLVVLEISANAFLQHMVRNIMGTLLEIGIQAKPVEWVADLLGGCDRTRAAAAAAPDGLYLADVAYAEDWALPPVRRLPATAGLDLLLSDSA